MKESEDVIRRLEKDGWVQVSQKGSHVTLKKDGERNLITVPHPRKELGKSLKRAIARAAGWK
jgi:predicted RNA binding protein YcfA (HicA-like mRNA interferase family)